MTGERYAMMETLGWKRPTEVDPGSGLPTDPHGSPNFFNDFADPVDFTALCELAINTLREVHAVRRPRDLYYKAFNRDGAEISLPSLGLERRNNK